jgi:WXXGXW repeat (2 copies)
MRFIPLFRSVVLIITIASASVAGFAEVGIGIAVSFGPPALPVYVQPPCPAPGWIWTPGYWAWDPDFGDYYWVPATWVLAPQVGFLWTPPYWAWNGIGFVFYSGYWGPTVGFYGGINYGYGYFGRGYEGGRWNHGQFYYNRTVNNINITNIHNVYNTTVINNTTVNRVSYNGGAGGTMARPTAQEETAARQQHIPPVATQTEHLQTARSNPELRASVNQGKPTIAATDRPGSFKGGGVVAAEQAGAPYRPPVNRAATPAARQENGMPAAPAHAKDAQPHPQPAPPYTGNAKADQQYQQQQQKLYNQQEQEHQKLAQQQEAEHQRAMQQQANQAQTQEMEQRHQQQTQQMEQQHHQQQQQLMRQAPPPPPPQQHGGSKPPK